MSILTVGVGKQFTTIPDAIAASSNGDVIQIDAGDYVDQYANINTDITLEAVGGMVNMISDQLIPNGKAIFVTNGDITIDGFSFSGAFVADGNGAGIRYETGNLTLTNDYFHDNQEGLLGGLDPTATLVIDNCEFDHNGDGSGFTHNLYVGAIAQLTITDGYFHDAIVGHEIKSRAFNTTITNSRIQDEGGSASYSIDAPNGGNVIIQNNVIEQGAATQNPAIIAVGEEGGVYANTSITVSGNTILNDLNSGSAVALWNATSDTAQLINNAFYGLTANQIVSGLNTQSGDIFLTTQPALDESHPFTLSPPPPPPPPSDLILIGGKGRDVLIGGDGNDTFDGKSGKDIITTGNGNDTIIFDTALGKNNIDQVTDFNTSTDVISLDRAVFAAAGDMGTLSADAFLIGSAAHDASDRIIYNSSTGALSYDPGGSASGASTQFATLSPGLNLTNLNFKIV